MIHRCAWVNDDPLYIEYHDLEWGVPVHDDRRLLELLILEGVQAGLSWYTVLKKRKHYRMVFDDFDARQIAAYGEAKIASLLADPGIIRSRLKISAAVDNAKAFLRMQDQYGSFDAYIWQFAGHRPIVNYWKTSQEIPAKTRESEAMSKSLKKNGFRFVGSTICYAFMQAVGMVNDHVTSCFRHTETTRPTPVS